MKNKSIPNIVYLGVDIGKNSFHIVDLNSSGKHIFRARMIRERLIDFFFPLISNDDWNGSLSRQQLAFQKG